MPLGESLRAVSERARALDSLRIWVVAAIATVVAGFLLAAFLPSSRLDRIGAIDSGSAFDIPIFRCAAQIVGNGDPYTIEPLATCERLFPKIFKVGQVAPAPQPPYVLAIFKPFSHVAEDRFSAGWTFVNIALAMLSAGILARVSGFPGVAIFFALTWGPGFDVLTLGQLSMAVILGVSWSAFELQRGHPRRAACALTLAMIVPHVGLPAFAALFVLVPAARLTIVALFMAGLGASLAISGPQICWEYVSRVLPLQALAEATMVQQYSLTIWLTAFGVPDKLAVRIGELQYALLAVLSFVWAGRLRARLNEPAFVVALPTALSVVGGPFIHYSETIAMWPAVLLFAKYSRGSQRIVATVLVALLATPWRTGIWPKLEILEFVLTAYIIWAFLGDIPLARRSGIGAAILVTMTFVHEWIVRRTGLLHAYEAGARMFKGVPIPPALGVEAPWGANLAPMTWGTYIRSHQEYITVHEAWCKFATIATYLMLFGLMAYLAYAKPRAAAGRHLEAELQA
jgi:hypothetical protein